ncbi:hypothetical protein WME90_33155 [Sorangium sp. So ce375]|uniref:hypothetical protein n=1 Tax=Sorangium sp. So ce375 TaxID=3133306 RepID=UPI003F5C70D8
MLKLRVIWPNAGHALLPEAGADVRLEAGGAPLPLASMSPGVREFDIPDGTARVVLKATFTASFGAVGRVGPMSHPVLQVEQPYDVVAGGTMLEAANIPAYVKSHPLVDTKVMANVNGAALAQIRTEFVNITPFWMAYAAFASEYIAEHQPGDPELVALGYTGGKPLIWFASVPAACAAPPAPGVGCIVFFRPESYTYTRIDEAHHQMFGLNRYLLKPVDDLFAEVWRIDRFRPDPADNNNPFVHLRAGFEDALSRSQKPVVILHPWPSGSDFGAAIGASLPALAGGALRLLWAEQRLARNRGAIQLGRLGVAGYSAGGLSLWAAFASNRQRVSEVYAFDARGTSSNAPAVIQWFNARSDAVLRMTGGYQLTANEGIRISIEKLAGGPVARVTATPPDSKAYEAGKNPLWDHVIAAYPHLREGKDYWHQFAIFGGYVAMPGPFTLTFLQQFLQDSLF